jgi:hypothetical protein
MMMTESEMVKDFVETTTYDNPGQSVPLIDLLRAWREQPGNADWSRCRFVAALGAAGFEIGEIKGTNRMVVVHRSTKPGMKIDVVDGIVIRMREQRRK